MNPMTAEIQNITNQGFGLLAAGYGFVVFVLIFVAISVLSDWVKKKQRKESENSFDPNGFNAGKPQNTPSHREARPLSVWEEEIRKMLRGEQSPPPVPQPLSRPAPPRLPVASQRDPFTYGNEGDTEDTVPTYLTSMERPDTAFDRGSHIEERVRSRMVDAGNHSDSNAAFARADRIDTSVAARMAAAGMIHRSTSMSPTAGPKPSSRNDLQALVEALRAPVHAKGAIVASIILGPPKALER
jgi:hypothetical protein